MALNLPTERSVGQIVIGSAMSISDKTHETSRTSERRADVIRAATKLFLQKGFAGTSMTMLGKAADIQKATLYHHFSSKEALFVACVTEGFDAGAEDLKHIRDDVSLDPTAKLTAAIKSIQATILHSDVGRMSPIIAEVATSLPAVGEQFYTGFIKRQHDIVDAIIDEGVAAGVFRPRGREGLRYLIFGPVVTLSLSRQMLMQAQDREALLNERAICDDQIEAILELCVAVPVNT
ncbi:MAG: TetR/AcrR family transcriptional regulator [Pseudomonadota bacterium]